MAFCGLARLRPPRAGSRGEKRANVFERYTEKARRVIFFARYEASQYGSQYIETEHLLLGLMREDFPLVSNMIGSQYGLVCLVGVHCVLRIGLMPALPPGAPDSI